MMRWGIVPWFAKSELEFEKLSNINAKSDRLTDSKMWRVPFAKRRCLIPASGLYERPKLGHAISETLAKEETCTPADCADPLVVSGGLFSAAPKPARKAKRPSPSSASSQSLSWFPSQQLLTFGKNFVFFAPSRYLQSRLIYNMLNPTGHLIQKHFQGMGVSEPRQLPCAPAST
jgi:hypothetical protein